MQTGIFYAHNPGNNKQSTTGKGMVGSVEVDMAVHIIFIYNQYKNCYNMVKDNNISLLLTYRKE